MLNGARLSVNGLYSIVGVDWLLPAGINFSSTTALQFAELDRLPSNNTMGPVNARPLQNVRMNHSEQTRGERPRRFLTSREPKGQQVKMFKQVRVTPAHVKERAYSKKLAEDGDARRYGELGFRTDETISAAYDKAEMRKEKILVIASSDFVHTSKSLFSPIVVMLAGTDIDWMQSTTMAIGV